jgi:hypothetical protein
MNSATPDIVYQIVDIIVNPLIYFLFALATVYFLWGGLKFIQNADEPSERALGAKSMMFSLIGFAIMLSAFGIVNWITRTIGVPDSQKPTSIDQLK